MKSSSWRASSWLAIFAKRRLLHLMLFAIGPLPLMAVMADAQVLNSEGRMLATQIINTITKYMDAFNANDLDTVMTFFSDDAIYEPGDGKTHRGKAEIRAAFEPQFKGAFGAMRFDEHDRLIDVENRKVAIRYVCRHDISHTKPRGFFSSLRKIYMGWVVGDRFGWQGIDVFHFDADGKFKKKFSYGWFGSRPYLQSELK
jgi:ketosteroid isomerase-like protein